MKFIRLPVSEKATTVTYQPDESVVNRLGFRSVHSLAGSLPPGAEVIDVGAGLSRLGHTVTALRDDIHWTNFDIAYLPSETNPEVIKRLGVLAASAPENLKYLGGNILNPPQKLNEDYYDRIFSFWMLPHIVKNSGPRPGVVAAWNMINMGKPGGILTVGPLRSYGDNAQSFEIPDSQEKARDLAARIVKPLQGSIWEDF